MKHLAGIWICYIRFFFFLFLLVLCLPSLACAQPAASTPDSGINGNKNACALKLPDWEKDTVVSLIHSITHQKDLYGDMEQARCLKLGLELGWWDAVGLPLLKRAMKEVKHGDTRLLTYIPFAMYFLTGNDVYFGCSLDDFIFHQDIDVFLRIRQYYDFHASHPCDSVAEDDYGIDLSQYAQRKAANNAKGLALSRHNFCQTRLMQLDTFAVASDTYQDVTLRPLAETMETYLRNDAITFCNARSTPKKLAVPSRQTELLQSNLMPVGLSVDVKASSHLPQQSGLQYETNQLLDNKLSSAWVEGASGHGIGEYLDIRFSHPATKKPQAAVNRIALINGYAKSEKSWRENSRIKTLHLHISEGPLQREVIVHLADTAKVQVISGLNLKAGDTVRATIKAVYKGEKYQDTALTELMFYRSAAAEFKPVTYWQD